MKPVIRGYKSNVKEHIPSEIFENYGQIFGSVWIASAYKGAQGELALVTKTQERVDNQISWINLMKEKVSAGVVQFDGVALTGSSRYDHFLALCDLLPQAIPQLASSLQALKLGRELDTNAFAQIETKLGCNPVSLFFF